MDGNRGLESLEDERYDKQGSTNCTWGEDVTAGGERWDLFCFYAGNKQKETERKTDKETAMISYSLASCFNVRSLGLQERAAMCGSS